MPVIKHKSILCTLEEWCGKEHRGEGQHLPDMLQVAVPLWMMHYRQVGPEARRAELNRLEESDFTFAFNDLAKAIALLSFCPGGVKVFGNRYRWQDSSEKVV